MITRPYRLISCCQVCSSKHQRVAAAAGSRIRTVSRSTATLRTVSSQHYIYKRHQQQHNISSRYVSTEAQSEIISTATVASSSSSKDVSYRQQFKQEKKRIRDLNRSPAAKDAQRLQQQQRDDAWELTVGIEIHAELDTERKLFSSALTSSASITAHVRNDADNHDDEVGFPGGGYGAAVASPRPNTNVALHDLAYPGAQPVFQIGTVVPAIRAALALGCNVHRKSAFDRKHYFYADQPAGYQITQFYRPFATDGLVVLGVDDGVVIAHAAVDGASLRQQQADHEDLVKVGIERVQLEQDTAKSLIGGGSGKSTLLDFNRTSHPLIEIVSRPDIHDPRHAAAYVRKVQEMLRVVGAVTAGMESGGLRADVNVSVRRRAVNHDGGDAVPEPLGQRTEIKNLSSLKAIEDAVTAERDRQIRVLEAGGEIKSETRGWTLGGTETTLLRSKEGEVDYRYMPDPDIPPLIISTELIERLRETAPALPDSIISSLQQRFGISSIAARILYHADDGARLEYLAEVVSRIEEVVQDEAQRTALRKSASNYVIHDIPSLLTKHDVPWTPDLIPVPRLAELLLLLGAGRLHKHGAKALLARMFTNDDGTARNTSVFELATHEGLLLEPSASDSSSSSSASTPSASASPTTTVSSANAQHDELISTVARQVFEANEKMVSDVLVKRETKKINFFAGQVMRELGKMGKGKAVDPKYVSEVVHDLFWRMYGK